MVYSEHIFGARLALSVCFYILSTLILLNKAAFLLFTAIGAVYFDSLPSLPSRGLVPLDSFITPVLVNLK